MKTKLLFCLTLITFLFISSCKKKDENPPAATPTPAPANEIFFKFSLDGVEKNLTSADASIHTGFGGGSITSSGIFNFSNDISISLHMPLDSIMGSDLQSLVGTKIPIGSCGGCPTNIELDYALNGNDYSSSDAHNTLPNEYIKFNSVTFQKSVTSFGKNVNQYFVTGEFNLKLNYGTDVKSASNGTFKLLFREAKH